MYQELKLLIIQQKQIGQMEKLVEKLLEKLLSQEKENLIFRVRLQ